jgi:predicted peptidase
MNLTMIVPIALGIAALTVAGTAEAKSKTTQTGFLFKTLKHGGRDYKYVVYVPREYDASKQWPLILFLHGAGESGTDGLRPVIQGDGSAIQWSPDKWPFVVVIPQKPDIRDQWEQHDDAVMAMLAQARKDYNADPDRIYLTGLSQGGHGTWVLGARHADIWAAIAPICGYGGVEGRRAEQAQTALPPPFSGTDAEIGQALKSVPVWAFHGEADSVVPVQETKDLVAQASLPRGSFR